MMKIPARLIEYIKQHDPAVYTFIKQYECPEYEGGICKGIPLDKQNLHLVKQLTKYVSIQRRYRGPRHSNKYHTLQKHATGLALYLKEPSAEELKKFLTLNGIEIVYTVTWFGRTWYKKYLPIWICRKIKELSLPLTHV